MHIVCSYCRKDMGEKAPLEDLDVTHSICPVCKAVLLKQYRGLTVGEWLDQFDEPVMLLDEDTRVVAANQEMADLLGKSERELFGLLGGEAMLCAYARDPSGCGNTVHCRECTVRNTVMKTIEDGVGQSDVRSFLERKDRRVELTISTQKKGHMVSVAVRQAPGRDKKKKQ